MKKPPRKKIVIDEETFWYFNKRSYTKRRFFSEDWVDSGFTDFYLTDDERDTNVAFRLQINIEDPSYSKEHVRRFIMKGLEKWKRTLEISRGEII